MKIQFVQVVSEDPYIFEVSVNSTDKRLHLFADWYDGSDYAKDHIQTALDRSHEARDVAYWLQWFGLSVVAFQTEQAVSTELQDALRGKPALSRLYERMSFRRWETVDDRDEKNLERLIPILLDHRIEIERPRGEKKVRMKKMSE